MKLSLLNGLVLLLSMIGCNPDYDLRTTLFIRDKKYPDLPQYSEWGYNTFGAYFNDEVFVSGDFYWDPATLAPGDTMILSFHGERRNRNGDTTDMVLSFKIPRNSPVDSKYLLSLQDSIIDLSASDGMVMIHSDYRTFPFTVTSGDLHFIRVQNLFVDNSASETILSGTFEFEGIMNGNSIEVTLGRFDVGVYFNEQ